MTLIWPFKVTKGQTDFAIRTATYVFLLVLYSNYSAISHLENVGIEEIMKIHKTQSTPTHEYTSENGNWLGFSWPLGHAAMRNIK